MQPSANPVMTEFHDASHEVAIALASDAVLLRRGASVLFRGGFAIGSDRDAVVFGCLEGPAGTGPATLRLARQPHGLNASLHGRYGQCLLGPLVLQPHACKSPRHPPLDAAAWPAAAA